MLFLLSCSAFGEPLSTSEALIIRDEVSATIRAFQDGDTDAYAESMHESLRRLYGGAAGLKRAMSEARERVHSSGVTFVDTTVTAPAQSIRAGSKEICFIPYKSIVRIGQKLATSVSYFVAIREGKKPWTFIDGSLFRDRPELIRELLPELSRMIQLPPNFVR